MLLYSIVYFLYYNCQYIFDGHRFLQQESVFNSFGKNTVPIDRERSLKDVVRNLASYLLHRHYVRGCVIYSISAYMSQCVILHKDHALTLCILYMYPPLPLPSMVTKSDRSSGIRQLSRLCFS